MRRQGLGGGIGHRFCNRSESSFTFGPTPYTCSVKGWLRLRDARRLGFVAGVRYHTAHSFVVFRFSFFSQVFVTFLQRLAVPLVAPTKHCWGDGKERKAVSTNHHPDQVEDASNSESEAIPSTTTSKNEEANDPSVRSQTREGSTILCCIRVQGSKT